MIINKAAYSHYVAIHAHVVWLINNETESSQDKTRGSLNGASPVVMFIVLFDLKGVIMENWLPM